ncbi:hypothetical protein AI3057V1_5176 (plasmid) [Citrobacter freundii]|uniref:hypothetical protein n=1 Tax=Citrobacter freundii TaxID=546 RepID=UPI001E195371|nr:hypothetical protein [Citrobacter freundii]CAG0346416.1 hypothetical protein AI3057V1_5176 [Citrobacter freundii]CAH6277158.1 hypothetical protein AI3057V1_5176 [Citrobacter freundii]
MFMGIFIVAAGLLSLLESLGIFSSDVKWGMPLAVICFGLHLIYEAIRAKKGNSGASSM